MKRPTTRRSATASAPLLAMLLLAGVPAAAQHHDHEDHRSRAAMSGETEHESVSEAWTCSMHPQVRREGPGACPICGMDLIPVDDGAAERLPTEDAARLTLSASAAARREVRVTPVVRSFLDHEVRLVGKIAFDETRQAELTAWVPGRITRAFVDYTGVTVAEGDHMVELYSPDLRIAQEELIQSRASVDALPEGSRARRASLALLEATREKLRLWGLTREQIRAVERSGRAQDTVVIHAPVGGVVTERNAREGKWVETGTQLYAIADFSELWVLLDAYENDLPWLHYGQSVSFRTEAHPGERFEGRISFISPVVDDLRRTAKLRVNVSNRDGLLKPGMFVRAAVTAKIATDGRAMDPELAGKWIGPMHPEIVRDGPGSCEICGMALVPAEELGFASTDEATAEAPLVVPRSAVLVTGKRAVVYVRDPDAEMPTYHGREIVLGPRAGDHYLVRDGLREGELVVTRGAFTIDAEMQIRARPSMMSGDAPAEPHAGHGHGHE